MNDGKKILSRLQLEKHCHSSPRELSGGEKRRVQIARMIISNTDILIADEPMANLDKRNIMILESELIRLNQLGKTIIISTHTQCFFESNIDVKRIDLTDLLSL